MVIELIVVLVAVGAGVVVSASTAGGSVPAGDAIAMIESASFCPAIAIVTCCYYSSIPVANELHLASRESKSCLISGGDSS